MKPLTDRQVLERIRKGEIDYFSYLVKKYSKRVGSYVRLKVSQAGDRDDIVQETFLKFYKSINHFDIRKPVLPYLYAILKNELKMHWRSQKHTISLDDELITASTEEQWERDDVNRILAPLVPQEKKALLMVSQGYSYEEVARFLEKPINTIRTIIRRARMKLVRLNSI